MPRLWGGSSVFRASWWDAAREAAWPPEGAGSSAWDGAVLGVLIAGGLTKALQAWRVPKSLKQGYLHGGCHKAGAVPALSLLAATQIPSTCLQDKGKTSAGMAPGGFVFPLSAFKWSQSRWQGQLHTPVRFLLAGRGGAEENRVSHQKVRATAGKHGENPPSRRAGDAPTRRTRPAAQTGPRANSPAKRGLCGRLGKPHLQPRANGDKKTRVLKALWARGARCRCFPGKVPAFP